MSFEDFFNKRERLQNTSKQNVISIMIHFKLFGFKLQLKSSFGSLTLARAEDFQINVCDLI